MRRLTNLWWLVGAVLVAGVLVVSGLLRSSEVARQQTQQRAVQRQTVVLLRESVSDVLDRELALARVIGALRGHLAGRWPVLASIVTTQPVANSAGFIQPVGQQHVSSFERRTGLSLFESSRPGRVRPVAARALHLVLTALVQKGAKAPPLGLDLAANPLRRSLLLTAAETGMPVASPPVEFLARPAHRYGVVVYAPVRSPRGALLGWVSATYAARELSAMVTAHLSGVRLTIRDRGTALVSSPGRLTGLPATISVDGRRWDVWVTARSASGSLVAWLVLAFGLCLAAAASLILRQASMRARDVTRTLAQRDAEEAALVRIATLVAENATPAEVFALVAEQVGELFNARTSAVSRFDAPANVGRIVGGRTRDGKDLTDTEFALDGITASAQVYRTHGSAARTEVAYRSDTDPIAPRMGALAASGGIAAPIFVAGELWGALGAAYSEQPIAAGVEDRLERFARLVGLAISNAEAWDRLARQASTDSLTGLPNRRVFHDRLDAEIARAQRHDRKLSLVLLDLDQFKRINDEYGHQAGDRALVRFAQLLAVHTREGELIARIGGEEFGWLMPETDQTGAYAAADRIRKALEAESFPDLGTITVSAGVRCATRADDAETIINDADQALYWAKDSGRNMTFVYSEQARETLDSAESRRPGPASAPARPLIIDA
jgi:diguanylate cyclase (GGDEF)-like protein